jgi:hypothetical protein
MEHHTLIPPPPPPAMAAMADTSFDESLSAVLSLDGL